MLCGMESATVPTSATVAQQLALVREQRELTELQTERLGLESARKRLLETQAAVDELERLKGNFLVDSPHPQPADGVDYDGAKRNKQLYETFGAYEWLDTLGPGGWASSFGQPLGMGVQAYFNPLSTRVDRAEGRDRPFVVTEIDLGFIRGLSRIVCEINCPAKGVVRNLVNYTVGGRGFQYSISPKNLKHKPPDGLKESIQEVVDEFLQRTKWPGALGKEGELVRRWFRDGEYFLALSSDRVGRTDIRFVEPEQVTQTGAEEWTAERMLEVGVDAENTQLDTTFGIITAKHDVNKRFGYNAFFDELEGATFYPAYTLQHFKLSDTNIKRGISDFYSALKWLQESDGVLTNTAKGAKVQAAIAAVRQHAAGIMKSDVEAFRASKTDYNITYTMPSGNSRSFSNYTYSPGTILDIPYGLEYVRPPEGSDRGPAFVEVAQSLLRWIGTQWSMPEFMISGDASNSNYASTMVAESPFVKNVLGLQYGFGAQWHDIIWRVIYHAQRHGRFDQFGENGSYFAIRRFFKLHIEYPIVETRDRKSEADRILSLVNAGLIAPATGDAELGYDYDEQVARGAKQRPSDITARASEVGPEGDVEAVAAQGKGNPKGDAGGGSGPPGAGGGPPKPDDGNKPSGPQAGPEQEKEKQPAQTPESTGAMSPTGAGVDINAYGPGAGLGTKRRPANLAELHETDRDNELREAIQQAAEATDTEPTEKQKASGNYAKGKFRWRGLTVAIENPKGAIRSGVNPDTGEAWSVKMPWHYGYVVGKGAKQKGADGDAVDIFMGPVPESELIFIVDQLHPHDGTFDEHKLLAGFRNEKEARQGYLDAYQPGWKGLGAITPVTLPALKGWLTSGDTSRPVAESAPHDVHSEKRDEGGKWTSGGGEVKGGKSEDAKPELTGDVKKLRTDIGGSTGAYMAQVTPKSGKPFKAVVKSYSGNEAQVRNEYLANSLYEKFGATVPETHMMDVDGKRALVTKFVDNVSLLKDADDSERRKAVKDLQKHFVLDAWLANWDVTGLDDDNVGVADGKTYRIDNGGALLYRAQGGLKGSTFGNTVSELRTMRDPSKPRFKAFAGLSDDDVAKQIDQLESKYKADGGQEGLLRIVESAGLPSGQAAKLANTLQARYQYLLKARDALRGNLHESEPAGEFAKYKLTPNYGPLPDSLERWARDPYDLDWIAWAKQHGLMEAAPHDVCGESRDKSGKWTAGAGSGGSSTAGDGKGKSQAAKPAAKGSMGIKLEDNPKHYFRLDLPGTKMVNISDLVPTRTEEKYPGETDKAESKMGQAAVGNLGKHVPLSVKKRADGRYDVDDGNSTLRVAMKHGFKRLPVIEGDSYAVANQQDEKKKASPSFLKSFTPEEMALPWTPQNADSRRELFGSAISNRPYFNRALDTGQGVDQALGGKAILIKSEDQLEQALHEKGPLVLIAPLKSRVRASQKVANKYGGDWSKLTDLLRGTVAVDKVADIPKAVSVLRDKMAEKGWKLAFVDDRMAKPLAGGYRDLSLNFERNGHVAEMQVNVKPMLLAKIKGHKLYERARHISENVLAEGREATPDEEREMADLNRQMESIYSAAWKEAGSE